MLLTRITVNFATLYPNQVESTSPSPQASQTWLTSILAFFHLQAKILHQIGNSLWFLLLPQGLAQGLLQIKYLQNICWVHKKTAETESPVFTLAQSVWILLCAWSQVTIVENNKEEEGDTVPDSWGIYNLEESSWRIPWDWGDQGLTDGASHLYCT